MITVPFNSSNISLQNVKYRQNMTKTGAWSHFPYRSPVYPPNANPTNAPYNPHGNHRTLEPLSPSCKTNRFPSLEEGQSGLENPVTIKSKPAVVYTMCQNDTRAMVLVYLPPKSARSATPHEHNPFSPTVILQPDRKRRKLQSRLPRWMALRHTCTYTHTSTHPCHPSDEKRHRSVFYCFEFGATWVRIRTQPTVVDKFVLLYLNQRISLDSLFLFVTYTSLEEEKDKKRYL